MFRNIKNTECDVGLELNLNAALKQGKQFTDSELYFTRIITARKNYLPQ